MTHHPVRIQIAIASVLTLVLLAMTAVPVGAGEVTRRHGAEEVAFRLTNCLRTGGYVTKGGKCMSWGKGKFSKYVAPLRRSNKVSNKVAWPWVKRSVQFYGTRTCWIGHARYGSTVNSRFKSAGLKAGNGENMGCGFYGAPTGTVVRVIRLWQSEKKYNGWHWRAVKDKDFRSAGVGVARNGGRKVQVVFNFYEKVVN